MKLKRFVAGIVATALVGSAFAMASTLNANAVADSYTATLTGSVAQMGFWDSDATTCTVDHDGQYTLSLTCSEASEVTDGALCLIVKLDFNVYDVSSSGSLSETGITIDVNSVDVDGTSLNYKGSTSDGNSHRVDDDGSTIRCNIYNTWSNGQETKDIDVPFTVEEGSKINVTFTVSGLESAIKQAKVLAGEVVEEDSNGSSGDTTTTASNGSSSNGSDGSSDTTTTSGSSSSGSSDSDSDSDSGEVASEDTASATGDSGIAGVVLVCSLAGVGFVASRKRD
jgi:hypothetical protein